MSTFDRHAIIECLSRLVTPGIKLTALADELGVRKHEYAALRADMFDLVEDGTVVVLSGGAFALAPSGRPADPHAKPPPPPPKQKQPAAPKLVAKPKPVKPAKHQPGLPWRPPAKAKPAHPTEEYDPETGEVRAVAPAVGAAAKPAPKPVTD